MTDQPGKLELLSQDIAKDKREKLLHLFPEVCTEGGEIDFDRLKQVLGKAVDVGKERYGMTWPGKADCFKTIQAPSLGTLLPSPEESVNFNTTENLIIEGDNLEVLKLLQKSYLGKVKMIYIDPPYNTGNDFIYPDKYAESLQTYLEYTGQVDSQGKKFGTNTDADGRFHSKWINMMYPRLYLARNLLREDGVAFISIDDNEVDNLKKLCSEVFGEEQFIAQMVWHNSSRSNAYITTEHEYLLVFARSLDRLGPAWRKKRPEALELTELVRKAKQRGLTLTDTEKELRRAIKLYIDSEQNKRTKAFQWLTNYGNLDEEWRIYYAVDLSGEGDGPPRRFGDKLVPAPAGRHWMGQDYIDELYEQERIVWRGDRAYRKLLIDESEESLKGIIPIPTRQGSEFLKQLMGKGIYDKPKPDALIRHLTKFATDNNAIILDFFAGSGTTGHAVLDLNEQEGSNRTFILVQLPEPLNSEDKSQKLGAGFCDSIERPRNIAEITKERVRRIIKKLNDEDRGKLDLEGTSQQDRGFRVFKLAESNFKPWNAEVPHDAPALERQLELHVDHIQEGRTADDILYEILLKSGFPLTTPVETITLAGLTVHSVAGGALFICLERELTLELIRAMADKKPERVVCLDEGFSGNDQLKANAVQIFKNKGVTSFKTV